MAIKRRYLHGQVLSQINITPMVDVAMVLLIVFMLTAPLLQQGMPVNLPKANASSINQSSKDIVLTIQKNEKIYIGDDKHAIPLDEISGRLSSLFSKRSKKDLFIKADTTIPYGDVIHIMSMAKKAGIDRIGMVTQPE